MGGDLHLPKIAHTETSSHTIDSDFKLTGKNIRSQSVASDEYINGEHLQYSLKHKSERLGHKLMKRKWQKCSGSGSSPKPDDTLEDTYNLGSSEKKLDVHMPRIKFSLRLEKTELSKVWEEE